MYVHPKFAISQEDALSLARARGFGIATAIDARLDPPRPIAAHLPFLIKANGTAPESLEIEFHVSKANGIAACADGTTPWLLIVQGPDAYVSADWYASDDQVPTWLYEAVHFIGPVSVLNPEAAARHSDELSDEFEARLLPKPIWKSSKMTPARRDGLRNGIIAMTMRVDSYIGQRKLNQHKSDVDHSAITAALAEQPSANAREIGSHMQALRPEVVPHLAPLKRPA